MANTFIKIASVTVGSGGAATMAFTSIPATFTDLTVLVSARTNEVDNGSSLRVYFNNDTTNNATRELRAVGTTVASYALSFAQTGYVGASQSTANTFGTATIYFPNYLSSKVKSFSGDIVLPSNTPAENYAVLAARLWSDTSAITTITLASAASNFVQYSTATLYGIKNS